MPRPKVPVKIKTPALVDLHFHGALGVDFMCSTAAQNDQLARALGDRGLGGFLATTLSTSRAELHRSVERLGKWIEGSRAHRDLSLARPLGIHLEGPFISKLACGAHPGRLLRPATIAELEALWTASRGTLRLVTLAPEVHRPARLRKICHWARRRGVRLSIGHSGATQEQADVAFRQGFSGVTHAWNAMRFHQRNPGVLGAALGRPNTHAELILDGIHVAPEVIRWTRDLHGKGTCYVSDCAPAAGLRPGARASFGPLIVRVKDGACRLPGNHLAGGAMLLPDALRAWIRREKARTPQSWASLVFTESQHASLAPLRAIGLSAAALQGRKLLWNQSIDFKVIHG